MNINVKVNEWREDKIEFCVKSAIEFGEQSERSRYEMLDDAALDEEVHWFEYLYGK